MKKLLFALALISLFSCKKEEKTEEKGTISEAIDGMQNLNKISNSMDDITKRTDELKTMTPVSNDVLKAVIPETLAGMKRTEMNVGHLGTMNVAAVTADYEDEADKSISVSITDGAGETGSAMVTMLMMGLSAETERTTEEGFEKTDEINGVKAFVSEKKSTDYIDSSIQYLVNNRYHVSLEGDGLTLDELKKVMQELNLSSLK